MNIKILNFFIGFLIGCCLFSLLSCAKKIYPIAPSKVVFDSLYVHDTVIVRDTVIYSPKANTSLQVDASILDKLKFGDTLKQSHQQANLKIYKDKDKDKLNIDCECDTMAIRAQLFDKIHTSNRTISASETIVKQVRYVPIIVKILAWMGGGYLLVTLLYLSKKFWL